MLLYWKHCIVDVEVSCTFVVTLMSGDLVGDSYGGLWVRSRPFTSHVVGCGLTTRFKCKEST